MAKKNETVMINDAYAYYAQLKSPGALKYKKQADADNELINKEYIIEVLPSVKELKALKKKYKKHVKMLQTTKEYTTEEFKKRFLVDAPTDKAFFTDDDGDITYETIKVRKHASYQKGDPTLLVNIFGAQKSKGLDRNNLPVSQEIQDPKNLKIIGGESTLIGNGSLIKIQLTIRPLNTDSGTDLQFDLHAIQVLELVEFKSNVVEDEFEDEGGDFDDEVKDEFADESDEEPAQEPTPEADDDDRDF